MLNCPNCHQPINPQATTCPYCRKVLKAYGHPGIPLHQATGDEYLCNSCAYHEDDTCNFPQRPYAKECTLYQDKSQPSQSLTYDPYANLSGFQALRLWCKRNSAVLLLLAIAAVSLLLALMATSR